MGLLAISVIASVSLTIAIYILWANHYRRLFCDRYRQHLFQIRDQLFNKAADGEISFDDPAYHSLRYMINGLIRYAHKVSATSIFLMWLFRDRLHTGEIADPRIRAARDGHPEIFHEIVTSAACRTIEYCLNCSLLLRVLFAIFRSYSERKHVKEIMARNVEPMVDELGVAGAKRAGLAF